MTLTGSSHPPLLRRHHDIAEHRASILVFADWERKTSRSNYLALTFALLLVIFFYRYNVIRRWFGAAVQEQVFLSPTWAFPLINVSTGLAFLLAAAV